MSTHPFRAVALGLALALALSAAGSSRALQAGELLPDAQATDVAGSPARLHELVRPGPTLLVAITDRDAAAHMQAWFDAASRLAPCANRVSLVSISKPFFVSDGLVRSKARAQVPPQYWHRTLLETDGALADRLGLDRDGLAWAMAVAGDGRILAALHGGPGDPEAAQIWRALSEGD